MSLTVGELYVQLQLDSKEFDRALDSAREKLQKLVSKKQMVTVGVNVDGKDTLDGLSQKIRGTIPATQEATHAINGLGNSVRATLSISLDTLLTGLAKIGGALPSAVMGAADFEQGLSNVAATAGGLTDGELEGLRAKALEIGANTSLSATQATQAFEALVANGIKVDENFGKIADSTVALAEATGSNLTTAANVATDVIANFAGAGDNLDSVINGITGVTVAGKFGIDDYAQALANGGAAVAGMGVSLTDFNAVIAAVSSSFSSGAEAGTAFRNFISLLTPNSETAKDAMKELGLITADGTNRFYDANGVLKSQAEVFGILQEAFGNLSPQMRATYTDAIFGAEGITFLNRALVLGSDGIKQYAADIEQINASDIAATRLDNFNGALEALKGSFETLSITVGSMFIPMAMDAVKGLTEIVNSATNVVNALAGSQEAFASLSPGLQVLVTAIQSVIAIFEQFVNDLGSVFNSALGDLTGFFASLGDSAGGWGANVGNSFAAGIYDAIDGIISSLQSLGDVLSYWLQPGSPPRIAPDLDIWGKEAAEVYIGAFIDGFNESDLSAISGFTASVKTALGSLQDIGLVSDEDAITAIIGTKESFSRALNELRTTGSVSEQTFSDIVNSAGIAGDQVTSLAVSFFQLEAATQAVTQAQTQLSNAQRKLNDVQREYEDAISGAQRELDKLRKQSRLSDIDAQIKEQEQLANAIGGTGEIQAEAARKLRELELEREIAAQDLAFSDRIDAAQTEVEEAQSALDIAQEQQAQAKAQYELVQAQISAQKEQNALIKEQIELQKKALEEGKSGGGGGGGSKAGEIDKDKQAQDAYNYSLADTQGKLDILRGKLSGVKEGSAEYYQLLGQINTLEKKRADEIEKSAADELKAQEEKVKAERDYRYSIADTSGKLAILRDELKGVEEGSKEYYDILGQISTLERQNAKGGAGGGAGGIGGSGVSEEDRKKREEEAKKRVEDQKQRALDQKLAAEQARMEKEKALSDQSIARQRVTAMIAPFQQMGAQISAYVQYAFNNILYIIQPALTGVSSFIQSWIGIAIGVWNQYGAQITTSVMTAWNSILGIVGGVLSILSQVIGMFYGAIATFISENQQTIINVIGAAWVFILGIVNGALSGILGIVNGVLMALQGNWSGAWESIKSGLLTILAATWEGIGNFFNIVLALFGTNLGQLMTDWGAWLNDTAASLMEWLNKTAEDIGTWFTDVITAFSEWFTSVKESWDKFWGDLGTKATELTGKILTDLGTWFTNVSKGFTDIVSTITEKWGELSKLGEDLSGWLNGALSAVTGLVENFSNAAKGLGSAIIEGIKSGINSGIEGLKEAAKGVAQAAIDAASNVLKIGSPSRVMIEMGKQYTEGFMIGAQEDMRGIAAIGNMVSGAIPAQATPASQSYTSSPTYIYNIDAKGSTISEDQFRKIIRQETAAQVRTAKDRRVLT